MQFGLHCFEAIIKGNCFVQLKVIKADFRGFKI